MARLSNPEIVTGNYLIAGIKTQLAVRKGGITETQARKYICDFEGDADITVGLSDEFIEQKHTKFPSLNRDECEYMWTGERFCSGLLGFDGFMLHASAVVYKGKAYLFSAPSGTGKSTHTQLWCRKFGDDAYIINDDKPVIRLTEGGMVVYGTPWSGKTDQNRNAGAALQGICFLERAQENSIQEISTAEAVYRILNQTIRPSGAADMQKLLSVLDRVLRQTKVFKMGCNISLDAVWVAYEGMSGLGKEE